jgi:diguanylate cyclase (GGDEF)-like protein
VLWVAASLTALIGLAAVMTRAADQQLQADAEHTAIQWSTFLVKHVHGVETFLEKGMLTPEVREELRDFQAAGEVFRFKIYDREGRELLVSDELAGPIPAAGATPSHNEDSEHEASHIRAVALHARPTVKLQRAQRADHPLVYSEVYVPVVHEGKLLGVVETYVDQAASEARIAAAFRHVALAVAAVLCTLAGVAVWQWQRHLKHQREAERKVRYLAHHDALTGAVNRASFSTALDQAQAVAKAGGPSFAVLCIDLDHFKEVNDSLGHAAGDAVLRGVADRLNALVRRQDVVARLGGDEFALLQSSITSADEVAGLAERVVETLTRPYEVRGQQVRGGASVGAAIYGPDIASVDALLHQADAALYHAKLNGRGRFSFYDAQTDQLRQERVSTARDLREALHRNQLHLHFQPLYENDGRTLVGYEALVRWTHPQRGPVSPAEFIPLAEETGLIEELGTWVLQRGCEEAACWPSTLSLAVNLSALQFRSGKLTETVSNCLQKTGLPAARLELEITESLLMSNTDQVVDTLHELTHMGVRISMDDFGTGYSSLAYLWRFPFDKVKIDRAFTQNLDKDPKVSLIVRSIVLLAHSLNIRVNAEGVESAAQLKALQDHGCDEMQGFLLGRPTPSRELRHQGARAESPPQTPRASTDFSALDKVTAPAKLSQPQPTQAMPL